MRLRTASARRALGRRRSASRPACCRRSGPTPNGDGSPSPSGHSQWLDSKPALKPKTRYTYESLLRKVYAHLGDYPLAKLDRLHIETFVSQLQAEGLSASRVRQCHMMLGAMLDSAVANRILTHNVARRVELPRLRPARRRFLSHLQVRGLADAVGPDCRALILTLANSGIRWGEALAVRRRSCDLNRRRLHS